MRRYTAFIHKKSIYSYKRRTGNCKSTNKVKRRIRAVIAEYLKNNTNCDKKNFIFVARSGIENMSYAQLKNTIVGLLKKVQV